MAVELGKVREVCERVTASLGLELVEIEFRGGAGKQGRVLRVFIDRPISVPMEPVESGHDLGATQLGVTHDDCANVSREVGTILDVEDPIPGGEYLLEVSSPGLDRKLSKPADYERFTGSRVKLMTIAPVGVTEQSKGNRHFEGRLEKFEGGRLVLDVSPQRKQKPGKHVDKSQSQQAKRVEIELANVERANLVPEI